LFIPIEAYGAVLGVLVAGGLSMWAITAVLLGSFALVLRGAGKPLLKVLPPVVCVAFGLVAPQLFASSGNCAQTGPAAIGGLVLGLVLAVFTFVFRAAPYAGLGFGAGAMLGWSLADMFIANSTTSPGVLTGLLSLVLGLGGALWLPRVLPPTVKERAVANEPNYTVTVSLPFKVRLATDRTRTRARAHEYARAGLLCSRHMLGCSAHVTWHHPLLTRPCCAHADARPP
jgi:hypothetical protein